ncbi:MAG: methylmalonyl Co-A mutase-associated GTPase MeaB [Roseibium sp.]|nr:methylmalonyl Co-A mutase-associated GTPase MeaB [Roseibium sp.]
MNRPLPTLEALRTGGKRALAQMLSRLEADRGSAEIAAFLDKAAQIEGGHVLGLTGPPGVGKSTLTDALIAAYRERGERVAVLAIDPSSRFTGGALLGDRTRLQTDPDDPDIFVRSMAARDRLGGLSDDAIAAIALLRAVNDRVIVESVGIGQSESDLVQAADTVVLCIQPGSGDSLQFMKAGVMELPDIVVITKADMGAAARRAASDVAGALSLSRRKAEGWEVPVCEISARSGQNLDRLTAAVSDHQTHLRGGGRLVTKRAAQCGLWVADMVKARYGQAGLEVLHRGIGTGRYEGAGQRPFATYRQVSNDIDARLVAPLD